MKHLIKAISITLGLAFCASPVMAQFPKIPKVKVPKIGNGGKDPVKTVTGNTGNNSAGKATKNGNLEEYEAAMKQGGELESALKYSEAVPFYEKAVSVAPENPTQPYKQRAESRVFLTKEKDTKCQAKQSKMNDLFAAKSYKEMSSILNDFCDVKPESGSGCNCLISKAEFDKFETAYKKAVAADEKAVADAIKAEEEKDLAAKYPLVPDDGVTGSLHKAHVNKIVFSKTPITINSPESALTNTFNLGDDIYFRVFLDKSPTNTARAARTSTDLHVSTDIDIYVDDVNIYPRATSSMYSGYSLNGFPAEPFSSPKSTTVLEALSHSWGAMEGSRDANKFLTQFYKATYDLPAGAHKVKIVYKNTGISAEFALNVTEAGKLTLGKKICSIPIIKEQYKDYNKSLRIVPNAASLIKYEGSTLIKVVETESDWTYRKNGYGIVTRRVISGVAYFKDNKNGLYHAEPVQFVQENISSGGSKYGATVGDVVGDPRIGGYRFCKECLGK